MQRWLFRLLPVLGLLLIALSLTSALRPVPSVVAPDTSLLLRQIGHEYLRETGDSSSRIPAVREFPEGAYELPLSCFLEYDLLAVVTRRVLSERHVSQPYELKLVDAETGESFLGSYWPRPGDLIGPSVEAACLDRDQENRNANIRLKLLPAPAVASPGPKYWLLSAGSGLLLLTLLMNIRRQQIRSDAPQSESSPVAVPATTALGPDAGFTYATQQLVVNEVTTTLTFREAKLLNYLSEHSGKVLDRQTIHDAVWGDEGVMVGRSLDVFISRLRKKLKGAEGVEIQTVHGVGYRFQAVTSAAP